MNCEIKGPWPRYTWCPQDPEGVDHYQIGLYLKAKMGQEWGEWWLKELDRLAGSTRQFNESSIKQLVLQVCKYDAAEMVELLYPMEPEMFLTPRTYPDRKGELNALARCAQMGSTACLSTLLELGADPNGLDCSTGMNTLQVDSDEAPIVTPLDVALLSGQEECALLLEIYGGQPVWELMD